LYIPTVFGADFSSEKRNALKAIEKNALKTIEKMLCVLDMKFNRIKVQK
jgi:hypothetical protein